MTALAPRRIAYADPPYPGRAYLYADHPDFAGEVDHVVIVVSARQPAASLRDWIQCEPEAFTFRPKPETYVIGQKPEAFCLWVFAWLGAQPGDELVDLFPGSGAVAHAWERWQRQPALPIARSASAEGRAARRARSKSLIEHPTLTEDAA